jgi:hypothetical protein
METGVHGEHGVHVPRRVVMAYRQDINHVTVQHLHMVVPIVKETTMKRHRVLQPHVQVFIRIGCLFSSFCFYFLKFWFVLSFGNNIEILYYTYIRFHDNII